VELEEKFRNVATSMEVKLSEFETLFTVRRDKGKEKKEELKHDAIFQKENRPALIVRHIPHAPTSLQQGSISLNYLDKFNQLDTRRGFLSTIWCYHTIGGKGDQGRKALPQIDICYHRYVLSLPSPSNISNIHALHHWI